ncbi:hypothetical protein D9613_012476 [Agrocybe pediades]|uniref:Uncharacterized protein n=1 Tax=Agrocybe pediades TaxID=84607 RepID=A0A8H4QSZ9_9AGAR|nr:hypothetical protein D9613_012476 [Agrocybe pediades]
MTILQLITRNVTFIIVDGLLVWRCFHACGQSLRNSALPIGFLILEAVVVICGILVGCIIFFRSLPIFTSLKPETWDSILFILGNAMGPSAAATSLVSTFMICRQVYAHTTDGSRSRRRYRHVINALIQSSGLYSGVLVIEGILGIISHYLSQPITPKNMYIGLILQYLVVVVSLLNGIAPTLMVARLIVSSYNEDTEVSSFSFPKDLITHPASHSNETRANDNDLEDAGTLARRQISH